MVRPVTKVGENRAATRLESLKDLASPCRLCPRECGAKRAEGERGRCGMGYEPAVSSFGPHYGEEPVLVGRGGSGTVFFAGCNLLCLFCQNYDISHLRRGAETTPERLAQVFLLLQENGCENVNLVTPTHFAHAAAEAIDLARGKGLTVPVVYNCGGYEPVEVLKCLEGRVEIYMPDAKTMNPDFARAAMNAPDYPEVVKKALQEMQRQVGDLVVEKNRAVTGLLIRHLVMPGMLDDTRRVLDFIAAQVSKRAFVNVMGQYRPCHRAREVEGLSRRPTYEEIELARAHARELGLRLSD